MAISSVSGAAQYIPPVKPQSANPQQVKIGKDADGDNDGTKAGQVEKASETGKVTEATNVPTTTTAKVGSQINITA